MDNMVGRIIKFEWHHQQSIHTGVNMGSIFRKYKSFCVLHREIQGFIISVRGFQTPGGIRGLKKGDLGNKR